MVGLTLFAAAAAMSPDAALGRWRTETRNGIVEIARGFAVDGDDREFAEIAASA